MNISSLSSLIFTTKLPFCLFLRLFFVLGDTGLNFAILKPLQHPVHSPVLMAVALPKLSSGGSVRIRFTSLDVGTTKWREGVFEVHERDNKSNLVLKFNSGGVPKYFQVHVSNGTYKSVIDFCTLTCLLLVYS